MCAMPKKYGSAYERQKAYLERKEANRHMTIETRLSEMEAKLNQALAENKELRDLLSQRDMGTYGGRALSPVISLFNEDFSLEAAPLSEEGIKPKARAHKDEGARNRKIPPSMEEVKAYCDERAALGKPRIDPETFMDHYTANGWVQGQGKKIVDWKAALRTWEKNEFRANGTPAKDPGEMLRELREKGKKS